MSQNMRYDAHARRLRLIVADILLSNIHRYAQQTTRGAKHTPLTADARPPR